MALQVGDKVKWNYTFEQMERENRRFKKGRRQIGNAATCLSINTVYVVREVLPQGGVKLTGFMIPVSEKYLTKVE